MDEELIAAGIDSTHMLGFATLALALLPFLAAAIAPFVNGVLKGRAGSAAGYVLALVPAFLFLWFARMIGLVAHGETIVAALPWVPSLQIGYAIAIDGLSLVFALLVTGIGTLVVIYAGAYLSGHPDRGRFFSFIFLFMGAMLGLVLADNLLSLFVFWELTSVTSFLLIGFDHRREAARRAALQALVVTGGGGLALLAGVMMIAATAGFTSVSGLLAGGGLQQSALYVPILLCVLAGAFTKSAQFPFHFWLPNAMEAPTPVSAYLHSATMVKAGIYLLMRLNPVLGGTDLWTTLVPAFGAATFLAGAILALRQSDLKLMLAQTTVASLGLITMLVGFGTREAILAAAAYLVAHALFKGALFMVAGTIDHETGTRDIRRLGGLARAMPLTFAAALAGGLSMAGFLPLFGFVAKELVYESLAHLPSGAFAAVAVAFIGNAFVVAIAAAVALKPFLGAPVRTPRRAHEGPAGLWLGPVLLGIAGVLAGLLAHGTGKLMIGPMASAVAGHGLGEGGAGGVALHLVPTALVPAFALSLLTILAGLAVAARLERARAAADRFLRAVGWGPDKGFDQAVRGLVRLACGVRDVLHGGHLEAYITLAILAVVAGLFAPMIAFGLWPDFGRLALWPADGVRVYELAMLLIAVIGLWAVFIAKSRLVAIVSLGIQGFAVAVLFLLFGAPDLSFTQFMVETLSVVILALVMTRLDLAPPDHRRPFERARDGIIAILGGLGFTLLMLAVLAVPFSGRLSAFFTEYSRTIAHGRNIVNVIIVDFRGLDTLGEISVVLVTGLSILALMRLKAAGSVDREPPKTIARRQGRKTAAGSAGKRT